MITCFAPGRVELLGNHTDYNEGYVLSASIPYGVTASGSLLPGGHVRLSTGFQGNRLEYVSVIDDPFVRRNDWTDYPLGVVHALREAGHVLGGFEVSYSSDLPPGAGLSSSAAMEVSTVLLLAKLFGFTMSGIEFAKLCRRAENQFVGVQCGILDQVSSLFGKKDRAVSLDCRSLDVDTITFPHGVKLLIIQSGVPHALVGGEYNERRERCFAAAKALGVPFLRDADSAMLAAGNLPEPEHRRAAHIIGENERVQETIKLLSRGDVSAVGQLMSASHESSRVNFENSTPVLDMLVDIAKSTPGVLGARLTGGGFGGAIVVLVERDASHGAGEAISGEYFRRSGNHATVLECDLSDGALALNGFGII
jgi:galactokinase